MAEIPVMPVAQPVPVPDAVMAAFLDSARIVLEATWAVADCSSINLPGQINPKGPACEGITAIDMALKAAICADGSDAVIGYALVARSVGTKAMRLRLDGNRGPRGPLVQADP